MTSNDHRSVCSDMKKARIRLTKQESLARHAAMDVKVYELKIVEKRLSKKQKEQLERLFLEGKWFYNHILDFRNKSGVKLKDINTSKIKEVKHLDKDKNELVSPLTCLLSQQKQAIVARMISNEKTIKSLIKNKFQTHGSLKFKSELCCIPLKQYGNSYDFKTPEKVRIAGISGLIIVKGGRQLKNAVELANANLIKRADGYFLKFTTYQERKQRENNGKEIGLDFGVKTSITTSEGEKIDLSVGESDRLKKLQKELFRRVRGSNNRWKTIKKLRKAYQKQTNKKQDKANKIVHKLKAYSRIYMQDENIAGWHRAMFGKQVQHSCLGTIKSKLMALPNVVVLDRFIPTTKLCPKCHSIKNDLTLADRTYVCSCGYQEDRDVHAAKNMIEIAKSCFEDHFVPTEHREVTLMEFKTSAACSCKSGQGNEKITSFRM